MRRRREDWLAVIWIRVNDCVCAAYGKEKRARVGAMGLGIRHSMHPKMRLIVVAEERLGIKAGLKKTFISFSTDSQPPLFPPKCRLLHIQNPHSNSYCLLSLSLSLSLLPTYFHPPSFKTSHLSTSINTDALRSNSPLSLSLNYPHIPIPFLPPSRTPHIPLPYPP